MKKVILLTVGVITIAGGLDANNLQDLIVGESNISCLGDKVTWAIFQKHGDTIGYQKGSGKFEGTLSLARHNSSPDKEIIKFMLERACKNQEDTINSMEKREFSPLITSVAELSNKDDTAIGTKLCTVCRQMLPSTQRVVITDNKGGKQPASIDC